MRPAGEYWEISLEARWRRAALGALALLSAAALGMAGARHAAAHWLAAANDPVALSRALARDPDHAELHRQRGHLALLSLDFAQAERSYQAALRHHRHDPQSWLEYSFVCEAQGDVGAARTAVLQAVELAPASASALQAAGNFFARQGEWASALACFRRAIASDWRAAAPVLEVCWRWAPDRARILTHALPDRAYAYEAYLQFLVSRSEWEQAAQVWEWARQRGKLPGAETGLAYVDALLAARRPAEARRVWQALVPPSADSASADSGNLIHNPGFRQPMLNGGFGWLYAAAPGVELAYDRGQDGATALALRFSGRDNPDYWHLRQVAPVEPEAGYRLEASLKTEGITSTSGPRLEVRDSYSGRVLASSDPAVGSTAWRRMAVEFQTPEETELVTVGVRRVAAPAWDEPIAGTLWLRDFSLRPVQQAFRPSSLAEMRAHR